MCSSRKKSVAKRKFVMLEFNELNLSYVERYIQKGELPTFARLLREHGFRKTSSEVNNDEVEPWIQWVTVHSGKRFSEHGVYRLGDIAQNRVEQIWEVLEARGLTVGAFSPMNAHNALKRAAFFVPDPWTPTSVSGSWLLRRFHQAICQGVQDNAVGRLTPGSVLMLLVGLAVYGGKLQALQYVRLALGSRRYLWRRALFLDRMLADSFLSLWRRTQPDFSSLFLNGVAHIQHHYLFSAGVYEGSQRNPSWYVEAGQDPVLESYRLYDQILAQCLRLKDSPRVLVATALHQQPMPEPVFYWRVRDPAEFLRSMQIRFLRVEPRMSRDFLVVFENREDAAKAETILGSGRDAAGHPLFEVDNRGESLFVTLSYPLEIFPAFRASFDNRVVDDMHSQVVFVALKNAHHDGIGFLMDSDLQDDPGLPPIPLNNVRDRIVSHFPA